MVFLGRLISLLPLVALVGCANGYHCYSCGQVSFNYRPPNPMPFSVSEPLTCKDSIGRLYLANMQTGVVVRKSLQNSPAHDCSIVGSEK